MPRLIGELGALVAEHPLRERLRCQLMLALYRSGRQAEALGAYRQAQRELSDALGLEPGEELKALEQAILRQDPALDLARTASSATPDAGAPSHSLLIVPQALAGVEALVRLAEPLAASEPPRELIVAMIVDGAELGAATTALAERRRRAHDRRRPDPGGGVLVGSAGARRRSARRAGDRRPAGHRRG